MNFRNIFGLLVVFLGLELQAQDSIAVKPLNQYPQEKIKVDEYGQKYYYDANLKAKIYEINGESVLILDDLVLNSKPRFNNELDRNYYYFLNKKLNRVYPLFYNALINYRAIQKDLQSMEKDKQKEYTRKRQNELANEYEAQLRDLTTTEGQIFAKLMNRATGKTVYEIIKELRGGWSAFWWNVKGNMVNVELKIEYNPHKDRTDEYIESLLQSNWSINYLKPYPDYDTFKVTR